MKRRQFVKPAIGTATIVAHLGNIAYRTRRKIRWDTTKAEIVDDPEASELLGEKARKPWDLI